MKGSGIRVTKDGEVAPTVYVQPVSVITHVDVDGTNKVNPPPRAPEAFSTRFYVGMTDANFVAHFTTTDTLQIKLGQLAMSKGTDLRVKAYGDTLVRDHNHMLQEVLERQPEVGSVPLSNDQVIKRQRFIIEELTDKPAGKAWDTAFIQYQFFFHQNQLEVIATGHENMQDRKLKHEMDESIPVITHHREMARDIATALSINLP
ncbi:MAG TPA: DUF4142 domain-containing protein [Gemmatimonadaceae bacterium]|nr:DUF4142 domain-containing protein [Gemmatimonadaceae bacterium]